MLVLQRAVYSVHAERRVFRGLNPVYDDTDSPTQDGEQLATLRRGISGLSRKDCAKGTQVEKQYHAKNVERCNEEYF